MADLPPQMRTMWEQRARRLTHTLIVSGALNLGLLTTVLHNIWRGEKILISSNGTFKERIASLEESSYGAVLLELSQLSFLDLVDLLKDTTPVELGLLRRDLALAVLHSIHQLDLERALGTLPSQVRLLHLEIPGSESPLEMRLFLGLQPEQFAAISQFVREERWPFTPSGLFTELKKGGAQADPSLIDAFSTTSHFYAVAALFSRTGLNIDKKILISLLLEGDWELLDSFAKEPAVPPELLWQKRREFLLAHLTRGSRIAARILVETDTEALLRRLTDGEAAQILSLLSTHTPNFEKFLRGLLASPRSDPIWQAASERLHSFTGERSAQALSPPHSVAYAPLALHPVLGAVPGSVSGELPRPQTHAARHFVSHLVKEGDSLWKIARLYGVTIDAIMEENNLENERLRPGTQLMIPRGSEGE